MLFDGLIKKILERKAGRFSAKILALKGAEPIVNIGGFSAIAILLFKALGIDIDEKTVAEIAAGATALYSLLVMIRNYFKNKSK